MNSKINKFKNLKKLTLVKSSILIGTLFPVVISGCNNIDVSNYYLVHNDGKYYICTKSDKYINSCDIEYKSILDGEIVGVICSNNNNFDYQLHHFSTKFLSELQVCNMKYVINNNINIEDLKNIASSNRINEIGDYFFRNRKYYFEYTFDYYCNSTLNIFKTDNRIIVGYDMSPKRLFGTSDYVYSIIDNEVVDLSDCDTVAYNLNNYFSDDSYITYNTVSDLVKNKKFVKVLEKVSSIKDLSFL